MRGVNLMRDGARATAEAVKRRLSGMSETCHVYVSPDGEVAIERRTDPRTKRERPAEWLVGTYSRKSSVSDLEADLECRLDEIRMREAA